MHYAPGKPLDALIDSFWQVWLSTVLLALIGVAFIVGGIALAIADPATRRTLRQRLRRLDD